MASGRCLVGLGFIFRQGQGRGTGPSILMGKAAVLDLLRTLRRTRIIRHLVIHFGHEQSIQNPLFPSLDA